jgi:hypothetical protein
MNETKLKQKLESSLQNDEKLSAVVLITVISIAIDIFVFMYQNCNTAKGLIKRSAKKQGFLYRKFLKTHVYPKLNESSLTDEEKETSIEKIRQLILNDQLDEFIQ